MEGPFKYRAFISYSHADEKWCRWLHKSLETYKVPKRLVGQQTPFGPVPERFAPVFRDREELATSTSLGDTLTQALEDSACQIVDHSSIKRALFSRSASRRTPLALTWKK